MFGSQTGSMVPAERWEVAQVAHLKDKTLWGS